MNETRQIVTEQGIWQRQIDVTACYRNTKRVVKFLWDNQTAGNLRQKFRLST